MFRYLGIIGPFRMTEPATTPERTWRRRLVRAYLTLDDRSLGAGRIALGLVLLLDLAKRVPGISTWYTNEGLLPNHTLLWQPTYDHALSLFYAASYSYEVAVGFLLCGVAYFMLLLGWRTRPAQVLSLVAVLSLHGRVLFVQNGGNVVLSELCLWTCFLPMGRRFSLDALCASRPHERGKVVPDADHDVRSIACLAILLQLAVIYFFNGIQKTGPSWREGSAVHYVFQSDGQVTWVGLWLRPHLTLAMSRLLTQATVFVELAAPVLILLPFGTAAARMIAIGMLFGLHSGFSVFLNLGIFSPAMIACFPNLLPRAFWTWASRPPSAGTMRRMALWGYERLAPIAAALGRELRQLLALSPRPAPAPSPLTLTRARRYGVRLREATVLGLILIAATQVCVENPAVPAALRSLQPDWAHVVVNGLQLLQGWAMFTPEPPGGDRTIVVDAVTTDGRHVDPLNETARGRDKPRFSETTIPAGLGYNVFFGTYVDRIADFPPYHLALMEWILRYPDRTGRAQDTLTSFTVSLVENDSPPPGGLRATNARARILFRYPGDR
jgi:uncharacterized membrane protein YphA (DoxX/SURF4 family)